MDLIIPPGDEPIVLSKEAFHSLMQSFRDESARMLETKMKELERGIIGK
jgi:hypothetical protein